MHRRFSSAGCSSSSPSGSALAPKDELGGGRLLLVELGGGAAPEFTGGQ